MMKFTLSRSRNEKIVFFLLSFKYNVALNEELGNINCGGIPMSIAVQTDMATPALARYQLLYRHTWPPQL